MTVELAALGLFLALALALVLVVPRLSTVKLFNIPVLAFIEIFRNTPLLVQVYLVYFAVPLVGMPLSAFVCGVIALSVQHAAFLTEILRGGIQSIASTQWEAARALGMRTGQVLRLIVVPQAFKKLIPALTNQLIILTKDTTVISAIGVMELALTGKVLVERSGESFTVFLIIAIVFLTITSVLGLVLRSLEADKRLVR